MVGLIILTATIIAIAWVRGIDNIKTNHPDYLGEDLFDEDDKNNMI
jgi:hypothetical protein